MKYEELRYFLFTQTYVAKQLVSKLRKLYRLPKKIKGGEWDKKVIKEYWYKIEQTLPFKQYDWRKEKDQIERGLRLIFAISEVSELITPQITQIAKELNINEKLFRIFVLYNDIPEKLNGRDNYFFAMEGDKIDIKDTGLYIKVDHFTQRQEVLESFNKIKFFLNDAPLPKRKGKKLLFLRKRKDIGKDDKRKIDIFLKIEREIESVIKEKQKLRKGKNYLEKSDVLSDYQTYKWEMVKPAIEKIIVKEIKDNEFIDEFALIEKYKAYYYDIIERYSLPTVRDLNYLLKFVK